MMRKEKGEDQSVGVALNKFYLILLNINKITFNVIEIIKKFLKTNMVSGSRGGNPLGHADESIDGNGR